MDVKGAVLREVGGPLRVEEVELVEPGPTDVLVRLGAAGLCHTDLEVVQGAIDMPLPMVLGHEGAGIVEQVGSEVRRVGVGDRVILSWNPACGYCFYCTRDQPLLCETCGRAAGAGTLPDGRKPLSRAEEPIAQFMFMGSHADHALVTEAAAVPVPGDLPFGVGAAIGCGITTGIVPALHAPATTVPGSVIVIVGCGIVGLSVVAGARLAGGARIVALDRSRHRLELAGKLGADRTVDIEVEDPISIVRGLTADRGADHVFEAAGNPMAMRTAFDLVRPGGELTMLGKLPLGDDLGVRFGAVMGNKTFKRLAYGGARPGRDFPGIARLYLDGRLPLDLLVDRELPLASINEGLEAVASSQVIRAVIAY